MMKPLVLSVMLLAAPAFANDASVDQPPQPTPEEGMTLQADDRVLGADDAADELVIYASVTCGHCGAWFTEEWPVLKDELVETGKLRVALREFPTPPQEVAMVGFMIAGRGNEESWYPALEAQFEGQEETFAALRDGKGQERFTELGKVAGLESAEEVEACFTQTDVARAIETNIRRGLAADIDGVPAFFLNGEKMGGKHSAADIAAAIAE